jgi:hypothetical protein
MNNSEIMRIYKQLIPKKTEFIQENNHTKNLLLRLEEQRRKNRIQYFNSLSKKINIDKYKYYSIFFNDKIFDIDRIKLLSIRLFHNLSLDEFIEIIYNNKYINDKIKERICIFIVNNINKMMNKDKLNKFLITLYSDETRFQKLYYILKEIFFEKNNSDLFKFIMFLYKKYGISPFMDIFEFCYDQKDIEKFVRIFILTSGNRNTKYNNLMSFKNLLFNNIVSKLEKGYYIRLQMFLHEFDGGGNGKTEPILNYNPPHFKNFMPDIFERVKNLRNKLKTINKTIKSNMNEVN